MLFSKRNERGVSLIETSAVLMISGVAIIFAQLAINSLIITSNTVNLSNIMRNAITSLLVSNSCHESTNFVSKKINGVTLKCDKSVIYGVYPVSNENHIDTSTLRKRIFSIYGERRDDNIYIPHLMKSISLSDFPSCDNYCIYLYRSVPNE